jgi:hypothetical protein
MTSQPLLFEVGRAELASPIPAFSVALCMA